MGEKRRLILEGEGHAEEIRLWGEAMSGKIEFLQNVFKKEKGEEAMKFSLAQEYIKGLAALEGKNLVIKSDLNKPEEVVNKSQQLIK